MCKEKIVRQIRQKNKITALELGSAMGISQSYFSEIELSNGKQTRHMQELLKKGFENLITEHKKSVLKLEADYEKYKDKLLDWEELS